MPLVRSLWKSRIARADDLGKEPEHLCRTRGASQKNGRYWPAVSLCSPSHAESGDSSRAFRSTQ